MARPLSEITEDLKMQIATRGGASISALARCFKINDINGDGKLSFEEFELVLGRAGLFLKRQELTMLFRYIDKDKSGCLDYKEFIEGLSGPVSGRRKAVALLAFNKFDKTGDGVVDIKDLRNTYDASRHPKVLSGQLTEEQVYKKFLSAFEGDNGTKGDGKVTKAEFLDYMADLSANFPYSDDRFVQMVCKAWRIKEDIAKVLGVDPTVIEALKDEIREKVRQRTTGSHYERNTLAHTFRKFDIDDSGKVIFVEFRKALATLGIQPSEHLARALFNDFDASGNGAVTYEEFSNALYKRERPELSKSMLTTIGTSKKKPAVIFVIGGPGTGKGTQCAKVVEDYGYSHLSTGDLLRAERKRGGSKYGKMINDIIKEGKLVPSDITVSLLKNAVEKIAKEDKSFLFLVDGFPRSIENLEAWEQIIGDKFTVATTMFFTCDEKIMVERLLKRAKTSGRSDDNAETIKKRLKTYRDSTLPVLKTLRAVCSFYEIDCAHSIEKVYEKVSKIVGGVRKVYA
ncbi:hypothetical protein AAMO2058_000872700 [Amorphochlora amoebiformis]